tara:strand:- start:1042 stop:2592 length:1551 start_codon:yes stop_codon:yes gene_type:complete
MEGNGMNNIFDLFKYNILLQKLNEKDYYSIFIIIFGFILYNYYNHIYIEYKDIYLLVCRIYYKSFGYSSSVTLKGQYITKHTSYSIRIKYLMSDNFKALWKYILNEKNLNIHSILECYSDNCDDYDQEINNENTSLFIVDQTLPFQIDKHIFCIVEIYKGDDESNNSNSTNNIKLTSKNVTLTLFSYIYDINYLKQYIENIKNDYLKSIEDKRKYMKFYYKLKNIDNSENEITWYEKEFHTNKSFDSLYIENKDKILNKVRFFLENEQWYKDNGHPYTLGIGLHGPPGTGKTSFIKCLAQLTGRHIIEISLNKLKSENDLYDVYYDNKYHKYNKEPIDFKDKIIIFEDIDCMSDIVLKREYKNQIETKDINDIVNVLLTNDSDNNEKNNESIKNCKKNATTTAYKYNETSSVTLSSLLNIMDGISEDNGRILIMTSNHWSKLDDALVRPGRIDIEIEMGVIDENILNDYVYKHYNKKIAKSKINKMNFRNITPCIMINEHINSSSLDEFINKLINY